MATMSPVTHTNSQSMEDPAEQIARILEEHFDEMGWSEDERNRRVSEASDLVSAAVARHAKSA